MEVARVEYLIALVALLGVLVDLAAVAAIGLLVVVALSGLFTGSPHRSGAERVIKFPPWGRQPH